VYDYQQKSKASDLTATETEPYVSSGAPNGVWLDNQPTAGNGIKYTDEGTAQLLRIHDQIKRTNSSDLATVPIGQ
jgi:hypothetical protein